MNLDTFLALSYKERLTEVNRRKKPVLTLSNALHEKAKSGLTSAELDRFWALEVIDELISTARHGNTRIDEEGTLPQNRLAAKFVLDILALIDNQLFEVGL